MGDDIMILNPDCVRLVLLFIQDNVNYSDKTSKCPSMHEEMTPYQIVTDDYFKKQDRSEVSYALELLIKENYISCIGNPDYDSNGNLQIARINGLEWKGHELLNNIQDDTIWKATKKRASQIGKVSISALAYGAKALTTAWMTDPNAFDNLIQGISNFTK